MKFKSIQRRDLASKVTTTEAMEIDPPSTSLVDTPERPKTPPASLNPSQPSNMIISRPATPEIQVVGQSNDVQELSKPENIKVLVRQHVSLWKRCLEAEKKPDLNLLRELLTEAQENQKSLQKIISNKEIESYVKGWNPWDEKKLHFPAPEKTSGKAKRDKPSDKRKAYNDPRKWKEISEMIQAAKGLYDSTS
jgi:hypothetical protein